MIEPPPWPDPYVVLGVTRDATHIEIARAYRALARRHHPDTRADNSATQIATENARWRQILAAYTAVGDPDRRADYDRATAHAATPRHRPQRSTPVQRRPADRVQIPITYRTTNTAAANDSAPPLRAGPVRRHR